MTNHSEPSGVPVGGDITTCGEPAREQTAREPGRHRRHRDPVEGADRADRADTKDRTEKRRAGQGAEEGVGKEATERVKKKGEASRGKGPDGGAGRLDGTGGSGGSGGRDVPSAPVVPGAPRAEHQVTLRTPAELADALPYLLGHRPDDSIVLVAVHDSDGNGRFGGRARLGIPDNAHDWAAAAEQLARGLVRGSERRTGRPDGIVAFLCRDSETGETAQDVMERLRPLAQRLRTACGRLDVPVVEALCITDGRFWSYCCPDRNCCPPDGTAMGLPGTSVLAAAAAYAGIQVRGGLRELRARLTPWETAAALEQEAALDAVSMSLIPRILDDGSRAEVAAQTLGLARRTVRRLAGAPPVTGALPSDLRDDGLIPHDEAAVLLLGLQDRTTRDRAAEWMEGDEAEPALRLWRALARRCVGPYAEYAAAPLTLAGWVAWSCGDELEAREALAMALAADPEYLFARLLHQACNEGLDPEAVRRCLRGERDGRADAADRQTDSGGDRGEDSAGLRAGDREDGAEKGADEGSATDPGRRRVPGAETTTDRPSAEASTDRSSTGAFAGRSSTETSVDRPLTGTGADTGIAGGGEQRPARVLRRRRRPRPATAPSDRTNKVNQTSRQRPLPPAGVRRSRPEPVAPSGPEGPRPTAGVADDGARSAHTSDRHDTTPRRRGTENRA
ncbi:hypothetical protein GCM10010358_26370 [Streptomyces minutiscleroticus]|uniref:DUF4192 domain-containing protein n=1 Tax=Streptomyces minutiscleroticus TaxID=68238 RepID=A0A918KQJ8_9ACTN|nr:DUF4192 domain-containing protein [Streptomyces minutiscleroticus]GGX70654.1 hypothetical protein GCM10010358_26370 [Streptomyces minutiscleroticus]